MCCVSEAQDATCQDEVSWATSKGRRAMTGPHGFVSHFKNEFSSCFGYICTSGIPWHVVHSRNWANLCWVND